MSLVLNLPYKGESSGFIPVGDTHTTEPHQTAQQRFPGSPGLRKDPHEDMGPFLP